MATVKKHEEKRAWSSWAIFVLCLFPTGLAAATKSDDNAALLYYQAFIRCPPFDSFPSEVQSAVFQGTAAAKDVTKYVEQSRDVIELIEAGSRISRCDWVIPPQHVGSMENSVALRVKTVLLLVGADARILVAGGYYRKAFERILTLRRFAVHVTNDPNLCMEIPLMVEDIAMKFTSDVLGVMPPERETLTWLNAQLTYESAVYESLMSVLWTYYRETLLRLRADREWLPHVRTFVPRMSTETYRAKQKAWDGLGDDELVRIIGERDVEFLNAVAKTLAGDMLYEQKCTRLDELDKVLTDEAKDNPAIIANWTMEARTIVPRYSNSVRTKARFNALHAAIGVYLTKAEKGQLPEDLPSTASKDPFSGKDFGYERTPSGFILRCRIKPVEQDKRWEFEFKVREKN